MTPWRMPARVWKAATARRRKPLHRAGACSKVGCWPCTLASGHLIAGLIELADGRFDAAVFNAQVSVEAATCVDEFGILINQSVEIGGISLAATAGVMEVFGHRILAAGAQWLATQQPPAGQQAAAPRTEARERNPCIIRASRVEAAARTKQRADPALVQTQQPQYQSGQDIHVAGTACGV